MAETREGKDPAARLEEVQAGRAKKAEKAADALRQELHELTRRTHDELRQADARAAAAEVRAATAEAQVVAAEARVVAADRRTEVAEKFLENEEVVKRCVDGFIAFAASWGGFGLGWGLTESAPILVIIVSIAGLCAPLLTGLGLVHRFAVAVTKKFGAPKTPQAGGTPSSPPQAGGTP